MTVDGAGVATASEEKRRRLLERWKRGDSPVGAASAIPRRPHGSRVPASTTQQRFWFVDQLFPGQPINNLAYRVDITGRLDLAAVRRALREIVRRHEVLRLRLELDDEGTVVQQFDSGLDAVVPLVDVADRGPVEAERAADELTTELARQPFDLTASPLFRAALVRTAADRHSLALVVHHAIFDGWSTGIFLREFTALYTALTSGTEPTLPPPPLQYGDYAVWQADRLGDERLARSLTHWAEQLTPEPARLDLPLDLPRPATQSFDGRVLRAPIPHPDTSALKALAADESATLFMALLALYQLALHRFTGQRDFAIGTPVANRSQEELRHLIGPFMNLLVFRTDLEGDPSLRDLLVRVRQRVRAGFAHQDLPFQALVEQLSGRRDPSRAPLFQVVLALQNFPPVELSIDGLVLEPRLVETGVAQAELALFIHPDGDGGLECLCEYNVGLFREMTVRHLLEDFAALVHAVTTDPDRPMSEWHERVPLAAGQRSEPVALGFAQERMWILHQLLEEPAELNVALALDLEGTLDLDALRSSLEVLLTRHESLRTAYVVERGETLQVARPPCVDLVHHDLSTLEARSRVDALRVATSAAADRPFDLTDGCLVRAVVLELEPTRSVLVLVVHAIAADRRSLELLVDEVLSAYTAARTGAHRSAPPLVQMGDFALWQRRALRGARRRAQLDHWRDRLASATGPLALPPPSRYAGSTIGPVTRPFEVPPVVEQRLRALGAPLFDVLLSTFAVLLSRYGYQETVVVGIRPGNRAEPGSDSVVGCLAHTLPLVVRVDGDVSFRQLIGAVGSELRETHAHQEVLVDELAAELGWAREPGRHPLCRALFVADGLAGADGVVERAPDIDLVLRFMEHEEGVRGSMEVRRDRLHDGDAESMVLFMESLLDRLAASPDSVLGSVATVGLENEAAEVVPSPSTRPSGDRGLCLHELFEDQTRRRPDADAIVEAGRRISYGKLSAWSNRLAHGLVRADAPPGEPVALLLGNGAVAVAHMLGALKAGAAFAFLDPSWPAEYAQRALAVLRPSVLVVDQASASPSTPLLDAFTEGGGRVIVAGELADQPSTPPEVGVDLADLAYVAFTSGSTGPPKAIPHSHGNLAQYVGWQQRTLGVDATQRMAQLATLTFDVAYCEVFGALCCGATLCIRPESVRGGDPAALGRWLRDERITVLQILPRLFRLAWQSLEISGELDVSLSALRHLVFVGEALPTSLVTSVRERLGAELCVVNIYGPTEAIAATFHVVAGPLHASPTVPVGKAIDGRRIVLVDRTGNPVPPGALGEIWIRSDHLAAGYMGDDDQTRSRFVTRELQGAPARFYRTGDLGQLGPDGLLEFHGREDHQVKLNGIRVELDAIEAALAGCSGASEYAAAVHDREGTQRLVLYVVGVDTPPHELLRRLRGVLPHAMVPSEIVEVPAIPRTATGKVDRRALLTAGAGRSASAPRVAPRTPTEVALAEAVQEVLGIDAVGIHDDFFELGGNSLQAAKLANRIRAVFALELPLQVFFDEPTIAAAAQVLDEAAARIVDERRAQVTSKVDRLTDAEVAAMLAELQGDR